VRLLGGIIGSSWWSDGLLWRKGRAKVRVQSSLVTRFRLDERIDKCVLCLKRC
jgi:hypothetical protein